MTATPNSDDVRRAAARSLGFGLNTGAVFVGILAGFLLLPALHDGGIEYGLKAAAVIAAVINVVGAGARVYAHVHDDEFERPVWDGFGKVVGLIAAVWTLVTAAFAVAVFSVLAAAGS